ncbi:DsbA family protein [Nocardioides campestrisoli]|uniref:DsbA family protein n=1 Tax=Nocardioides campestrisoli TaxID=2736757 RepID=UPI0015E6367E|nr:thioredoxin domain-containing protein [Nocardioides campestrisoli]
MANPPKKPGRSRAEEKAAQQARREARREKAARQAEALARERARRKLKERLIVGGVVLAVIAAIGGIFWYQQAKDSARENAAVPANITDEFALATGEDDAPRTVEIYEDFLCPACAQFELATADMLDKAAEDGKVQVKYYPIEILGQYGDYSKDAANAFAVVLDKSGPEVAKKFHDLLFKEQPAESGDLPDKDWLIDRAVEAGAEESEVRPGIEDGTFDLWVENATEHAFEEGVTGTPTVMVDGERFEGGPAELAALLG